MRKKIFSIIGVLLVSFSFINIYRQSRLEFTNYEVSASVNIPQDKFIVTNLYIESVDIRLPVAQTNIIDGKWQIYENGVSNLKNTNIFYAHNTKDRFKALHQIKFGDQIALSDQNNNNSLFKVTYILVVYPNEVDILNNIQENEIALYTCTGFADTKRLVIVASEI